MQSIKTILTILLALCCLVPIASCAPQPASRTWTVADLRLLDPPDDLTPSADLLAVYTRVTGLSMDIRVDLLDFNPGDDYALKISLWDDHYFYSDPLVMDIPSTGPVRAHSAAPGAPFVWPRVVLNPWLDTITVSLNRTFIGNRYHFDVTTYTESSIAPTDQAFDIRSDGLPPTNRAPLLLAFWNTFPAATPIQALRRWDGAHTGPLGERHGLKYLLGASDEYALPLALLDLKTPASLAALSAMGNIDQFQDMYQRGLLTLPDVAYAEPAQVALNFSRQASNGFGLPVSQFVYAASADPIQGSVAQYIPLPDGSHLAAAGGTRLIPLPTADALEATPDGPALEVRLALVRAAFANDSSTLVALGGSLPDSTWGNADSVKPAFEWIAGHPWIWVLSQADLMTFPIGSQGLPAIQTGSGSSAWLEALQAAPGNPISDSAWQTYFMLTAPSRVEKLRALRAGYLGQIGELLAAASWAENPSARSDCDADLNGDSRPECVLANEKFFAILNPAGARLTHFFYLDNAGPHQIIAPSSQFTVGLSDPSEWSLELGQAADPSVIPGAFAEETNPWAAYQPDVSAQAISFTSVDGQKTKSYYLTRQGLEIHYHTAGAEIMLIPLVVDPQAFYFGPTSYQSASTATWVEWGLANGLRIEIRTDASLSVADFTSSLPLLSDPENPNLQYPPGIYLPFPLARVSLQTGGNFQALISIK